VRLIFPYIKMEEVMGRNSPSDRELIRKCWRKDKRVFSLIFFNLELSSFQIA